jgi:hypothetical protein
MQPITRRAFLEQSGRAVLGAAAGLTVLRGWSHSPNDTIGVAIIGLNGQGKTHIRNFSEIEGRAYRRPVRCGRARAATDGRDGRTAHRRAPQTLHRPAPTAGRQRD